MPVPLLDVNAQNHPLEAEFTAAFKRVFQTGHFIMGQEIATFEEEIKRVVDAKFALGISSGTDAILLALMALGVGPGDEVLCPAFTFFATAGCVSRLGATPVFVDVSLEDFNLCLNDLEKKITPSSKVIIPVHLFGQSADMTPLLELAKKHGLFVVEDAAQAIGAKYHGQDVGTMGDFGCYSFFPSKNLGGLGDGGLLVTNNEELARKAIALRNHGMEPKYYHSAVGGNFRLDALQAAFLKVKIPHYASYCERRQANADYYRQAFEGLEGLILPFACEGRTHIWNQFTLRVKHGKRDALKQYLWDLKIGCEVYYPLTLDQQQCFADLPESSRQGCENSHQLVEEVLSLPIYPELSEAQRAEVAQAVKAFFTI